MAQELDPDAPEPLYEQLATILRAAIDAKKLSGRLPTEADLMHEYGISRGTVRRSIKILTDEGYVRISRGRGTFVVK
jgi:DNA-binding GntR family transcriptional regulator